MGAPRRALDYCAVRRVAPDEDRGLVDRGLDEGARGEVALTKIDRSEAVQQVLKRRARCFDDPATVRDVERCEAGCGCQFSRPHAIPPSTPSPSFFCRIQIIM